MNPTSVFMGSPEFALPTLNALLQNYRVIGVVTQPDKPAGRGRGVSSPPVKILAQQLGLALIQPRKLSDPEALVQLREWNPGLIVVAAFGQILRPVVLELPQYGCINVHASLLPRWRGASPINHAILHGDAETGITIMQMDAGLDTGPMLAKRAIPILPDDTAGTLSDKLARLGADLLLETLPDHLAGKLKLETQTSLDATYTPLLKKSDGLLDFTRPAEYLARQVRAFNPWPGAYLEWQGALLKVHRAHAIGGAAASGGTVSHAGLPAVGCAEGILVLDEVQPAGKRVMAGKDFLIGARGWGANS